MVLGGKTYSYIIAFELPPHVNKNKSHVPVLPEDDANRSIARGFHIDLYPERQFHIEHEAGGWLKVLECFRSVHVRDMETIPRRLVILLIDFDGRQDRLTTANTYIPAHLRDRVFVLGALKEPEDLKQEIGCSLESIGRRLAKDCRDGTDHLWGHHMLLHNAGEVARLRKLVRPILFNNPT